LFALTAQRGIQCISQMCNVIRYKIRQLAVFAVVPDLLNRIQLRCIGWQPFHVDTFSKPFSKPANAAAMNHPTVDDKDDALGKMQKQFSNKVLKIVGTNIGVLHSKIQSKPTFSRRHTDRRYGRQSIASVPAIMNRCMSLRSPCSPDGRLQHKAAFIGKYDGFSGPAGFFLCAANRSCARERWPVRHALWLSFRASGNSSPWLSKYARRWMRHRRDRSSFRLLRPPVAESKVQWDSRSFEPLSKVAFPTSAYPCGLIPVGVRGDCVPERMLRLVFRRLAATALWLQALHRRVWPSHLRDTLLGAKQWLVAAYVPIVQGFQWVSYPYYRHKTVRLVNFSKSNRRWYDEKFKKKNTFG